jgi:hypothetical protein
MILTLEVVAWLVLFFFALRGARWAYAIFLLLALVWIPARSGFHLHSPPCQMEFSRDLVAGSLTKYKHVVLWAAFFMMTCVQLRGRRHAWLLAAAATILMGILIELEEGATGTGWCKATDLLPDAVGALIGAGLMALRGRFQPPARRSDASPETGP